MIMHLSGLVAAHDRETGAARRPVRLPRHRAPRRRDARRGRRQAASPIAERQTADRGRRHRTAAFRAPERLARRRSASRAPTRPACARSHASARTSSGLRSTATASAAPRESASNESAPLPAKGSSVLRAVEILAEPVEQRFANPIGRRANVGDGGKANAPAAPAPADDANLLGLRQAWQPSRHRKGRIVPLPVSAQTSMLDLFKRKPDDGERSWSERLKSGLGLSRERISRPLDRAVRPRSAVGGGDRRVAQRAPRRRRRHSRDRASARRARRAAGSAPAPTSMPARC